jgi:hypothetical protein
MRIVVTVIIAVLLLAVVFWLIGEGLNYLAAP